MQCDIGIIKTNVLKQPSGALPVPDNTPNVSDYSNEIVTVHASI